MPRGRYPYNRSSRGWAREAGISGPHPAQSWPGRFWPVLGQSERFATWPDLTHRSESPYRRFLAPGRDQKGPKRPSAARWPGHAQALEVALARAVQHQRRGCARCDVAGGPTATVATSTGRVADPGGSKEAHAAAAVGPHRDHRRLVGQGAAGCAPARTETAGQRRPMYCPCFAPLAPTRRPSRFSHARSQAPGVRLPQAIPHVGGLQGPRHGARCGPRVGARTGAGGTQGHT